MAKPWPIFISAPITFALKMNRFFIFTLILCILGQALVRTAWVLHYQWNLAAYLEQCENKAKPSLHCNGKCHLNKKIAVGENRDSAKPELPDSFHQLKDISLFFEPSADLSLFISDRDAAVALPLYRVFLPAAPVDVVFRPPAAA